jgi:hypothetical protein
MQIKKMKKRGYMSGGMVKNSMPLPGGAVNPNPAERKTPSKASLAEKLRAPFGAKEKGRVPKKPTLPDPLEKFRGGRGYAKGGMVKANCGASMKPAQKGKK